MSTENPILTFFSPNLCPLTLPTSLRSMKKAMFEDLLTTIESILLQSAVLLRSATALSYSLIRNQAPAEILRLELNDTLLDTDIEYSRQDLDGLLEPCGVITPLEDRYDDTLQVRGSSGSLALDPLLSPVPAIQASPSGQIHPTDRTSLQSSTASVISPAKRGISSVYSHLSSPSHSLFRSSHISVSQQSPWSNFQPLRTPTASFSDLFSPGKCGISSVFSNLPSPARLPTPAAFNDTWVATDLRTPSLVSPVW